MPMLPNGTWTHSETEWALHTYRRIAIVGGPRTGKTTLAKSVKDRPVFYSDDFKQHGWDEAPSRIIDAVHGRESFVVEGVQVARALRRGLEVDAVLVMRQPRVKRSSGQEAMSKGIDTVLGSFEFRVPVVEVG